jgi:hypothetical protein
MAPYIPRLGIFDDPSIALQFGSSRFDGLSFRTTPIEILGYGNPNPVLSHATGFFWQHGENQFLITNRHVVTGRDSFTGDYITHQHVEPHRIRYFEIHWVAGPHDSWMPTRRPVEIDLFEDGVAVFLQDQQFEHYRVDIVAIRLSSQMPSINKFSPFVNHYNFEPLFTSTGDSCFVVGYPFSNYAGNMIPIWKRGSLASEPFFPVDNKPMFLLDALTKDGMSGSPVFRRVFGPATNADMTTHMNSVVRTEFVGVYSGRMTSHELAQAGLGICWYANRIPHIVSQGKSPSQASIHD